MYGQALDVLAGMGGTQPSCVYVYQKIEAFGNNHPYKDIEVLLCHEGMIS